ncbi:unannotated protein [freshwater metagenome]|uniref:Unannotated protein n=1 Tax=freshwater metagenome TaxID=449393 RepID=A0A6J6DDF3_9ZZZZ
MPAASAIRAPGASYAVTITNGTSPRRTLRPCTDGTVIRVLIGAS